VVGLAVIVAHLDVVLNVSDSFAVKLFLVGGVLKFSDILMQPLNLPLPLIEKVFSPAVLHIN
jgi:hypothetical protein